MEFLQEAAVSRRVLFGTLLLDPSLTASDNASAFNMTTEHI